ATDTTVVPLPPFTDEQAISTSPPGRERTRQGEGDGRSIRAAAASDKGQSRPYPRPVARSAAFFDLDKTVIARASMIAFGKPFRRAGMLSRRVLVRALWGQLVYLWIGASEKKLIKTRDAALKLTRGWDQQKVRAIVREAIDE